MKGKTVLITGASKGIGAAAAQAFADTGANVALVARSTDLIADLAGKIGERAIAIPCDVSRFHEMLADIIQETSGAKGAVFAPAVALLVEGNVIRLTRNFEQFGFLIRHDNL